MDIMLENRKNKHIILISFRGHWLHVGHHFHYWDTRLPGSEVANFLWLLLDKLHVAILCKYVGALFTLSIEICQIIVKLRQSFLNNFKE